jgi:hypothetical protein
MSDSTQIQNYKIIFTKDEDSIRMCDLQGFLQYFNMYYLKLNDTIDDKYQDLNYLISNQTQFKENFTFTQTDYNKYANCLYDSNNNLVIYELDKHSPLEMVIGGIVVPLVASIILSGGEIDIDLSKGKFKVQINQSLGVSLKELQQFYKSNES